MWVYVRSEPGLWTVGFHGPDGGWHTDSDHNDREAAAGRAAWLNGDRAAEAGATTVAPPAPRWPTHAEVQEAISLRYMRLRDDPEAYARLTNREVTALASAVTALWELAAGSSPAGTPQEDDQ